MAIALASALVNILYLTGAIYMMEMYDRVLPSRSIPTLVGLSVLALSLFVFQGILDILRARVLVRIGRRIGDRLSLRVFHLVGRLALSTRTAGDGLQPVRDIDQIRNFLSSPGPLALLDLPWIPFYIGACFFLHYWIGITALAGSLVLVALTLLTESMTRERTRDATASGARRNNLAEASRRNAEVLRAMGMAPRYAELWDVENKRFLDGQQRVSDVTGGLGAVSKIMRLALQSCVLGVGAYLVIHQQASAGIIIAGSIISGRALAPVDLAIANWRGFVAYRQSWSRLKDLLRSIPADERQMALPKPQNSIRVENLTVVPPGGTVAVVQDVSFRLEKGHALGIIGSSAAGKSCLARALVGVWPAARGSVRIDSASLDQWDPQALGPQIGYLPQDVELLAGTIVQNIARFDPEPDAAAVVAAAKAAGVHELILRLPNGYETEIGESGAALSAGQRQRIALARALFGDPFLIVLDEPNSNLDAEGDEALTRAILAARARGGIVIVVAHRPSAIVGTDLIMTMVQGGVQMFGPKDEVLGKLRAAATTVSPLRVANEPGAAS
jgi:ATP-binding cassette subfamily C protein